MKNLLPAFLLSLLLTLSSFSVSRERPGFAKGKPYVYEYSFDYTGDVWMICDEPFLITSGLAEGVIRGQENAHVSTGTHHFSMHGTAIGLISNRKYILNSENHSSYAGNLQNAHYTFTMTAGINFIGQGDASDFTSKSTLIYVIDANGQVKVEKTLSHSGCQ